ncbi:hypothetical protein TPHA_0I00430 [Tetrapisispora phaffii CBS 4417]|uniref:inorganic diphosphatase n=1 Tax=Tetrapisispora phaffii (strain ATCC 24235 / CBS 4417 / NBRC 1672 / NRRL Y-8282 / UCD 70-5) TaxID=1071381 RepID=G8BXC2_TETPH|nr:hypothetical protein TPHA_0I00430 [Tetrapisispora phaffii CBS 4417]CCE64550.1 hypothetical protein TPHA_0I00430 [Tetrapisispora phaffii CBS 4417]
MIRNTALRRLIQSKDILAGKKAFSSVTLGTKYTADFRQYLKLPNGEIGSYFHDIPIELNETDCTVQMVTEVSRWSNGKFEISKELDFNPIVQDVKNENVRFVHNIFPYHGYIHNYGALPQTWENPTKFSAIPGTETLKGDNDPLDCCEIGSRIQNIGDISTVKVLGSLGLIDDGELDWKVIVINVKDPMAQKLNDFKDVDKNFPGLLEATREWFRAYKVPAGKPENSFAFDGHYKNAEETIQIIKECHKEWESLISGNLHKLHPDIPVIKRAGLGVTLESENKTPNEIPNYVYKWHYINK